MPRDGVVILRARDALARVVVRVFALDTDIRRTFSESAGAVLKSVISLRVGKRILGDLAMTLAVRKRLVAGGVLLLIGLANLGVFVSWLDTVGVLAWAHRVCERYLTGTAITVIAALLILLPSGTVVAICAQRCRVCDTLLLRRGKYCRECGSRV